MKCNDCIHKSVCYKIGSILPAYADKCGNFKDDNSIVPVKPMVEIDLYSVIKQKYIERDVLDKIRAEIESLSNANPSYWHSGDMVDRDNVLEIIDKYKANKDGEE